MFKEVEGTRTEVGMFPALESLADIGSRRQAGKFAHLHYAELYERYLGHLRNRHPSLLELGVSQGQSLWMWLDYFSQGVVVGVDTGNLHDEKIKVHPRCRFLQWDQCDDRLLDQGSFDVIIDDAGHDVNKQQQSLKMLWPQLLPGGIYVIEDLETSYWTDGNHMGGHNIGVVYYLKQLCDHMTAAYACKSPERFEGLPGLNAVHWYPNIVFLEKL